ncbi:DNA sulfur modification protein DndB [Paenibacillus polysaccharolyticus]|uniref:DNA sulfur modification protein DndB n=1 Tax=Paenibacillus polysaccharolyticus TaxID=582692 RepID=A0A1G5GUL6_9BACL|nr:DGQHR domain-containing protein [Paenibacillus polysaccharolyticus]SCY54318.1 DNA sulfur modification protein DndB [Paenibacillus polysaccharolyticus]
MTQQHVIENVLQSKMRGKVSYLGNVSATSVLQITYVKPFDHPSGKGYQRPVDSKRCNDFALYLSKGEDALFAPIMLNAESHWEFSAYDKARPHLGRLICKGKASIMDGQHRVGGIKRYTQDTNSEINVPFLAFHYLDEDEEVHLFDIINTMAKGIGTSLSKYLHRNTDEYSWIATQLITRGDSPFHFIGTLTGKRSSGRHVTLQNLYKVIELLTKSEALTHVNKETKLTWSLMYFNAIKEQFNTEWLSYKEYRLTHIVCLNALAIVGAEILKEATNRQKGKMDYAFIEKSVKKMKNTEWSAEGPLKYLKGISGSRMLAQDLISEVIPAK